jgi:UPF0755 protein
VLDMLQTMRKGTNDVWVTVLEGWRNEEVADALKAALGGQFDTTEFLKLAAGKEGYLFPDTYLMPKTTDAATALSYMTNNYDKRVSQTLIADLTPQNRTESEAIILASIVEREANTAASKKIVADILFKRLQQNWPLQADATLQYAKGYNAALNMWWAPPMAEDKQLVSAYNTYLHPGLPPSPICNPGLDAIAAAINPQATDYWYYLTDNKGQMHYAATLEEQTANVKKYLQ